MEILRTPDHCFTGLREFSFAPNYVDLAVDGGRTLRMHYLDEGPADGEPILCLHGQPSWSFLYRKMIPLLIADGYRVIAPDLIGFGRSDKPAAVSDYTYQAHVSWVSQWLQHLDLNGLTLICQDWGGLVGMRVLADMPDRFSRLIVANTGLPDSQMISEDAARMMNQMRSFVPVPDAAMVRKQFATGSPGAFLYWVKYASESPDFSVRDVFGLLSNIDDPAILDGYCAPFPDDRYIAGARAFPALVPLMPEHRPERQLNDQAWQVLENCGKPVLTAFSDQDPVTRGGDAVFKKRIPGAVSVTITGGGHFLQEDCPKSFSSAVSAFMRTSSS